MRIDFRSLKILSAAMALGFAAVAVAAPPARDPMAPQPAAQQPTSDMPATGANLSAQTKFDALDVNHDMYVDKQEAAASQVLTAQFDKLDANRDGKLTLAEFQAAKNLAMIKKDTKTTTNDGY